MNETERIKLYDFSSSPNCQRVKIVLHEKKLPFQIIPINIRKNEQKSPAFLKLNPYGKVPAITDEETVLYESCIINEYLDEKYPEPPLMPKDPALRGKIRILIEYGLNHLAIPYQTLRHQLMKGDSERDQQLVENKKKELRELLRRLEGDIGEKPYFVGDFSLADVALITRFLRLETMAVLPFIPLPRLGRWLERMKNRPSVRSII